MVLTSWARAVRGAIALALVAGCSDPGAPEPGEATCDASSAGFACERVFLLSHLSLTELGGLEGTNVSDIWGWTDPETQKEYALVGRSDGTAFVDVTDAANAVYLGALPLHAGATPVRLAGHQGLPGPCLHRGRLRGQPWHAGVRSHRAATGGGCSVEYSESAHYDGVASAHNIAINEASGFAYLVGANSGGETCSGALHMVDIRDPTHPVFAGCFADSTTGKARTGYVHDTQCVTYAGPDARFRGHEICLNASESAIGIVDVTDKAHPDVAGHRVISRTPRTPTRDG